MNWSVKCSPIYGSRQSTKQLLQRIEISFYGSSSESTDIDFQAALRNSLYGVPSWVLSLAWILKK